VVGVGRPLLDDLVEVRERGRIELHVVEGLAHPELGLLLVRLAVAGFALDDLAQLDRRRIVVFTVVKLERALQHLRGLIAGRGSTFAAARLGLILTAAFRCGCLLLLGRGNGTGEEEAAAEDNADRAVAAHAETSLVVLESTGLGEGADVFTTNGRRTERKASRVRHLQDPPPLHTRVGRRGEAHPKPRHPTKAPSRLSSESQPKIHALATGYLAKRRPNTRRARHQLDVRKVVCTSGCRA